MATYQWMCTTQADGVTGTSAKADLDYAINQMENQLNNNSDVSTEFISYTPDVVVDTGSLHCSSGGCAEKEYVEGCLRKLWDENMTADGDAWIIVDGANRFGYGVGNVDWTAPDGQRLWGARVLHTPSEWIPADPVETFYNFAIQEVAHCFGAWHYEGNYEIDNGTAYDVSPLATGYAYIDDDKSHRDTCRNGSNTPPPDFACGPVNGSGSRWCNGCGYGCRHDISMTYCTQDAIDQDTPL